MDSAVYLAEHLAEVPAIVIPTIIGRHDGGSRPGLFDSVIQAAWSFCLALRARGLGTTWVTAALQDEAKVKEILGIPEHMTEIVLFPVAYTKGTEFSRAPRRPAREITYFDRFGTTSAAGPGDDAALRRRARRHRRDRHRRVPGHGVGAGHRHRPAGTVLRRVPRRRWDSDDARRRRGVPRPQPPPGDRRVDHSVLRRHLGRTSSVRLVHLRPRNPGPAGASTSNRPPVGHACGSATSSDPASRARPGRSP